MQREPSMSFEAGSVTRADPAVARAVLLSDRVNLVAVGDEPCRHAFSNNIDTRTSRSIRPPVIDDNERFGNGTNSPEMGVTP